MLHILVFLNYYQFIRINNSFSFCTNGYDDIYDYMRIEDRTQKYCYKNTKKKHINKEILCVMWLLMCCILILMHNMLHFFIFLVRTRYKVLISSHSQPSSLRYCPHELILALLIGHLIIVALFILI